MTLPARTPVKAANIQELNLKKIDNENYYQLCTINSLIAIDSHYHLIFEVFLYIVFSNII